MRSILDGVAVDRTVARPGVNLNARPESYAGDYATPASHIDRIRRALGGRIACDPASSARAQGTVRAEVYFTIEDDGLAQPIWLSPWMLNTPSARRDEFYARAAKEAAGGAEGVIVAGAKHTFTRYFQPLWPHVRAVHWPAVRLVFVREDERAGDESPTDGHVFLYVGRNPERFCACGVPLMSSMSLAAGNCPRCASELERV